MFRSNRRRLTAAGGALILLATVGAVARPAYAANAGAGAGRAPIARCGIQLCSGSSPWFMYGATVYNPGVRPATWGMDNPNGTVSLAQQAKLNTIRIVNFVPDAGNPSQVFFDETHWRKVDAMIAAAGNAGMRVDLNLADYRNLLWNSCINPYTASSWTKAITWVGNRRNTITGAIYADDPTIALLSMAGEPLPVGKHTFTARTTGRACTITYTTSELTQFYSATTSAWASLNGSVLGNSGGLGYLNFKSGIDWKAIMALPHNQVCDVKTYGGMLNFAATVASYCRQLNKPIVDEEYGWQQSIGDAQRATAFRNTAAVLTADHFAGSAFWNLGYQQAGTSYEVGPGTPKAFRAVQDSAPTYVR